MAIVELGSTGKLNRGCKIRAGRSFRDDAVVIRLSLPDRVREDAVTVTLTPAEAARLVGKMASALIPKKKPNSN